MVYAIGVYSDVCMYIIVTLPTAGQLEVRAMPCVSLANLTHD